ncbi:MAG: hypothetical protein AAEJ52_04105, partial [Myxococcota bacterium]
MDPLGTLRHNLASDTHWADRPGVAWAVLGCICLLIWAAAMHPIRDPDFGWHLALGRYIAQQGVVPGAEPFTHTALGNPMVAHEWLAQLLMYAVTTLTGIVGLRWLHATAVVALLLVFYRMLRRERGPPALAVAGVLLFAIVAGSRFELRPQMFNLAAMMWLFHAVFVRRPHLEVRQLVGISAAVALWANFHSGAILFPALIWVYVAVEWTSRRLGWATPRPEDLAGGSLARVALLGATTALATLLTPNHARLVPYVLESNAINRGLSSEWSSVVTFWGDPANLPLELEALAFSALAFVAALWIGRRTRSPGMTAVVCVLALLPLSSARFVDFYFAPIAFVHSVWCNWLAERPSPAVSRGRVSMATYALVLPLALVAVASKIDTAQFRLWVRPVGNFQPATFPAGAVRFLNETGLEGRLYNLERWGGYVLLHTRGKYPIFIDGRWVTIGERVARDGMMIEHRGERAFEKLDAYGVDLLLVPRGWMTEELQERRGWLPVFE